MAEIYLLGLIVFFLFVQGFFANSEMSVLSLNRFRLKNLANNGNERAGIILNLLNNPDRLFGTTLFGTNLATIILSYLADLYFHKYIAEHLTSITRFISMEIIILITIEPLILVFAELIPMSFGRKYSLSSALKKAKMIKFFNIIFTPVMFFAVIIPKLMKKMFKKSSGENGISREELKILFASSYANITSRMQQYIKELFDTSHLTAEDIMVPLNEVVACEENESLGKLKETIEKTGFTRIPVFKEDIFNITGTVHAVNILGADDKGRASDYIDKLYIVPATKPIFQILSELKTNRKYMAVVVDEYGAVSGLLTLEDILNEIFRDIMKDKETPKKKDAKEENIFSADMELTDFYEKTGIDFQDENVATLGGIINLSLGRIGRAGEVVEYGGVKFKVLEATDKVVKKVQLVFTAEKTEE
jgi:putative hemolysin